MEEDITENEVDEYEHLSDEMQLDLEPPSYPV